MKAKIEIYNYVAAFLLLLSAWLFVCLQPVYGAEDTINGNEDPYFKNRTKAQITERWENSKIQKRDSIYEEGKEPSFSAPYSGGVVKQEVLDNVLDNLNYYRWLIGSPEVTRKPAQRQDLQDAVVLQILSLNAGNPLTHWISDYYEKPADMSQEFYDSGNKADHNIISTYYYTSAVRGFFGESYFTYTAGHRTALLSPNVSRADFGLGEVTYGSTGGSSSQYDVMEPDFAAYPAPGYFPAQDFASESDWDIYLNQTVFASQFDQTVTGTITCLDTNQKWTYSKEEGNLANGGSGFHLKAPEKSFTNYEGTYRVQIDNLLKKDGSIVNLVYDVQFFDKYESVPSEIESISFEGNKTSTFVEETNQRYALKKAKLHLPEYMILEMKSGARFKIPISGYREGDMEYSFFPNYEYRQILWPEFDAADIPDVVSDPEGLLKKQDFPVYIKTENSDAGSHFKIEKTSYRPKPGENVTIKILSDFNESLRTYYWYKTDGVHIYPITNNEKYSIDRSQLIIRNVDEKDTANYFVVTTQEPDWGSADNQISKEVEVLVQVPPKAIQLSKSVLNLMYKERLKLTANLSPRGAISAITWKSSAPQIAAVDQNGTVTGMSPGTATIQASTQNGLSASCQVQVTKKATSITAKNFTKTYGNKPFSLGAKATSGGKLSYKSSNTKVATVSNTGRVTLKGPGKATITITAAATANYNAASKNVTITVKPKKVAGLKVKKGKKRMTVSWKRDKKVTGYQITYAQNKKFKKGKKTITISKNKTIKRTVKKLKARKTYYVKVRAYKKVGKTKIYGAYSGTKKVKVK